MSLINMNQEPIPHPNAFTAVGALCLDANLRHAFFHPETRALQEYLPAMHEDEFQKTLTLFPVDPEAKIELLYAGVNLLFCRRTPCPFATGNIETVIGAAVLDKNFRLDWFNDPEAAHSQYGFELFEEENIMICALLARKRSDLLAAIVALGDRLEGTIPSLKPLAKLPETLRAKAKGKAA